MFCFWTLIIVSFGPLAQILAMPQNRVGPNNPVGGFRPIPNERRRNPNAPRPNSGRSGRIPPQSKNTINNCDDQCCDREGRGKCTDV